MRHVPATGSRQRPCKPRRTSRIYAQKKICVLELKMGLEMQVSSRIHASNVQSPEFDLQHCRLTNKNPQTTTVSLRGIRDLAQPSSLRDTQESKEGVSQGCMAVSTWHLAFPHRPSKFHLSPPALLRLFLSLMWYCGSVETGGVGNGDFKSEAPRWFQEGARQLHNEDKKICWACWFRPIISATQESEVEGSQGGTQIQQLRETSASY